MMTQLPLKLAFLMGAAVTLVLGIGAAEPAGDPRQRTIAALERNIQADPDNAELWSHLGFAWRKVGNLDRARDAFEKASRLTPPSSEALFMLGLIYEKQQNKPQALDAWKRYLNVAPDPDKRSTAETHIRRLSQ